MTPEVGKFIFKPSYVSDGVEVRRIGRQVDPFSFSPLLLYAITFSSNSNEHALAIFLPFPLVFIFSLKKCQCFSSVLYCVTTRAPWPSYYNILDQSTEISPSI
jgi:hypothetical protein